MLQNFFFHLESINSFIWSYLAFGIILFLGLYFTITSKAFQFRKFPRIFNNFLSTFKNDEKSEKGENPFRLFLTALGGSIGIGNIVGISLAIQIGGPGALFWVWIAGILGMLLQYSEVYIGMLHRKENSSNGYSGGPMHFLPVAFKKKYVAYIAAFLLCVYGVELFIFNVISESISSNWHIPKPIVIGAVLSLVLLAVSGGVKRISKICISILPIFLSIYGIMAAIVFFKHISLVPTVFLSIVKGAFTTQAATGGFAGSTVLLTIAAGLSRGAYAGDLGIGYNSIIHCQTKTDKPHTQAALTSMGILFNTFIVCSISTFLVLITDVWSDKMDVSLMVQAALAKHFPYMNLYMPLFLFVMGYLTVTTYFFVGLKCAEYISPKRGKLLYYLYAIIALPLFAFVDPKEAFILMSTAGALLLLLNLTAIFILRKQIKFHVD
mgnify:CR=1 FL=1